MSESESQFFSEQNPHNNPASSSKGGGDGHGWYRFGFTDPEQRRQYRIFCQEDTNILLNVLTGLMTIASFLTRFNLSNFWTSNPTMVLSFVVGVVSVVVGVASTTVRLAQWSPIASYPLRPGGLGYRVREQLQSVHDSDVAWTIINDLLMLTFPTACSLNVLARCVHAPYFAVYVHALSPSRPTAPTPEHNSARALPARRRGTRNSATAAGPSASPSSPPSSCSPRRGCCKPSCVARASRPSS